MKKGVGGVNSYAESRSTVVGFLDCLEDSSKTAEKIETQVNTCGGIPGDPLTFSI